MSIRSALVRYAPDEAWPEHQHDELSISIVLAGHLTEQVGRIEEQAAMGSIVVKPAGSVHSNRFGPSGSVFLAIWPGHALVDEVLPQSEGSWRWRHDPARLKHWLAITRELSLGDCWGLAEEAMIGVINAGEETGARGSEPPARMTQIRDRLHALQPQRPSVARLARSVGLHPVYLARSFRRHYGCSISTYVRRLRVQKAASILIGKTPPSVAALAQELGFADQSHFCRTFRAELGLSPAAYRRLIA